MAHKSTLKIDGKEYEVLSLSYSFHQHVNPNTNETTSEVFGGNIDVSIETRNADAKIIELMVLPHKDDISGSIELKNQKGEELRTIKFDHSAIINFSESFSLSGAGSGTQSFTICSRDLDVNGAEVEIAAGINETTQRREVIIIWVDHLFITFIEWQKLRKNRSDRPI